MLAGGAGSRCRARMLSTTSALDEWLAGAKAGTETGFAHDPQALRERPLTGAMPYG